MCYQLKWPTNNNNDIIKSTSTLLLGLKNCSPPGHHHHHQWTLHTSQSSTSDCRSNPNMVRLADRDNSSDNSRTVHNFSCSRSSLVHQKRKQQQQTLQLIDSTCTAAASKSVALKTVSLTVSNTNTLSDRTTETAKNWLSRLHNNADDDDVKTGN